MEFRLLGPVEVCRDGVAVRLGGPRKRAVLAALAMRANEEVGVGYLADAVWERPPASLNANVRTYVASLRRLLCTPGEAGSRLLHTPAGYRLVVRPGELDLGVFEDLVGRADQAREQGDDEAAVDLYGRALAMWRGQPLAGLAVGAGLAAAVARLDERRLQAVEHRIECRLRLGGHGEIVAELRELAAEHPLRESLPELLMLALYRSGRSAEALEVYQRSRRHLVEQLGVEPGPRMRQLQQAILTGTRIELTAPISSSPSAVVPAELPTTASAFTGRQEECDRLDRLLDKVDDGVVTAVIAGMAGVGKTALALHWAHRVADRFPDGQVYLDMRSYGTAPPVTAAEALGQLLRSLGVPAERIPADTGARTALYRSVLAGRRILIVLDNTRSAEQVRPLLPGRGGCLVLVTSRDALAALAALNGAYPIRLDPLDPLESGTLLGRVIDDGRVRDEPHAVAELARLCGHLPLALRLAAARLSTQPRDTIGAVVARIGRDALSALRSPTDPAAAIRVTFEDSYLLLDEPARRLFRRLALAPGPDLCSHVAAALLDTSPAQVEPMLDRLVANHLVEEYTPGRYRLHDLLRQYAADRAEAEEPQHARRAAIRRVLVWYRRTAAAAAAALDPHRRRTVPLDPPGPDWWPVRFSGYRDALDWCQTEHRNLVMAVSLAADQGMHALAWQLPMAMFGFFELRKHWADWIGTHQIGLAAARRIGDRHAEAWTLNSLGIANKQTDRLDQAIAHYRQALAIRQTVGDRHGQAITLNNLGTTNNSTGNYRQATDKFRHALAIFRETGDQWGEALALTNLGEAHRRLGESGLALTLFQQTLAIRHALADQRGEGIVLHNMATTLSGLGRHTEAIAHFRQALRIRDQVGDRWGVARTLTNLGTAMTHTGDPTGARQYWHRALDIFEELGDAQATEIRVRLDGDQHLNPRTH